VDDATPESEFDKAILRRANSEEGDGSCSDILHVAEASSSVEEDHSVGPRWTICSIFSELLFSSLHGLFCVGTASLWGARV
jgi:hypothetical protein